MPSYPQGDWDAERIKALRKALRETKGMNQQDMAAALGVSASTVSRWETGVWRPIRFLIPALEALESEAMQNGAKSGV
jgi:DNA-binding transcriptional regulator YiaG